MTCSFVVVCVFVTHSDHEVTQFLGADFLGGASAKGSVSALCSTGGSSFCEDELSFTTSSRIFDASQLGSLDRCSQESSSITQPPSSATFPSLKEQKF